jgi:hypothetical protein
MQLFALQLATAAKQNLSLFIKIEKNSTATDLDNHIILERKI